MFCRVIKVNTKMVSSTEYVLGRLRVMHEIMRVHIMVVKMLLRLICLRRMGIWLDIICGSPINFVSFGSWFREIALGISRAIADMEINNDIVPAKSFPSK
ncbi:hypothetical protein D9M68_855800 [compost metagenome]